MDSRKEKTEMAKRTARDFSRYEIWCIATSYANTNSANYHEELERKYEISSGTFYNLLEKAVVENVVDIETVLKMEEKAKYNSKVKAGVAGEIRSEKHYDCLKKKRKDYMLPKQDAINITKKYAESNLYKKDFCQENHITERLLDRIILKTIIESWITDELVEKLKTKSLRQNSSEAVLKFWEQTKKFRENKKNQG